MRPPPGGDVGFAPAEQTHLADAGLMRLPPGGDAAVSQNCISALSFPGLTQPRAPGLLCPRRQSNQSAAGETPDPPFLPNRTLSGEIPGSH